MAHHDGGREVAHVGTVPPQRGLVLPAWLQRSEWMLDDLD